MQTTKINVPRGMYTVGELVTDAMKSVPEGLRDLQGARIEAWLQVFARRVIHNSYKAHQKAAEAAIRQAHHFMLDPEYDERRRKILAENRKRKQNEKFQRQITAGRGAAVNIR